MSKTLLFLRDHKIENLEQLNQLAAQIASVQQSEKTAGRNRDIEKAHHQLLQDPANLRGVPQSRLQQKVFGSPSTGNHDPQSCQGRL